MGPPRGTLAKILNPRRRRRPAWTEGSVDPGIVVWGVLPPRRRIGGRVGGRIGEWIGRRIRGRIGQRLGGRSWGCPGAAP